VTAPTPTRFAAPVANGTVLARKARGSYRRARRDVPLSAVLAVVTGIVAVAGGALDVDGVTRALAAVSFVLASIGFGFAVHAVATYRAARTPDSVTDPHDRTGGADS
jgi:uncharacterized membrane protein YphA (DoxX/SURF4 family)